MRVVTINSHVKHLLNYFHEGSGLWLIKIPFITHPSNKSEIPDTCMGAWEAPQNSLEKRISVGLRDNSPQPHTLPQKTLNTRPRGHKPEDLGYNE